MISCSGAGAPCRAGDHRQRRVPVEECAPQSLREVTLDLGGFRGRFDRPSLPRSRRALPPTARSLQNLQPASVMSYSLVPGIARSGLSVAGCPEQIERTSPDRGSARGGRLFPARGGDREPGFAAAARAAPAGMGAGERSGRRYTPSVQTLTPEDRAAQKWSGVKAADEGGAARGESGIGAKNAVLPIRGPRSHGRPLIVTNVPH
jgi:hypothetical protein